MARAATLEDARRLPRPGAASELGERSEDFRDERGLHEMTELRNAKFAIGDVVKHRFFPFRGVIFDVDPTFGNTEEWWLSIPEKVRPAKDQPYYHLLAENEQQTYVAYVSEQNLELDESGDPCRHPQIGDIFQGMADGRYLPRPRRAN
jgi:heat shock protein HspQ